MVGKKVRKVAIVGYTTTKDMAPYDDKEFEIWGLNDLYKHIKKYDRWFQIHTPETVDRTYEQNPQTRVPWGTHKADLAKMGIPVYMQDVEPDIPNSIKYPLDEIIEHFGSDYFTNSISYMIALAVMEGFEEIHVYGVDMATTQDSEYAHQRPSCEFWLGIAMGRGIKVYIPDEADLLKTRFMYGYEDEKKHAFEKKVNKMLEDIKAKKDQAVQQEKTWEGHKLQYDAAMRAIKEIMMAWQ